MIITVQNEAQAELLNKIHARAEELFDAMDEMAVRHYESTDLLKQGMRAQLNWLPAVSARIVQAEAALDSLLPLAAVLGIKDGHVLDAYDAQKVWFTSKQDATV